MEGESGYMYKDITKVNIKSIKVTIYKLKDRRDLIKWLFEVINDFKYSNYTLMRAISIFDQYSKYLVETISEFQLITITCLYIAAKIEETKTLGVEFYKYVSNCSIEQINEKEKMILEKLDFKIIKRIPNDYLNKNHLYFISPSNSDNTLELLNMIILGLYVNNTTQDVSPFEIYNLAIKQVKRIYRKEITVNTIKDEVVKFFIKNNSKLSLKYIH